MSVEQAYIDRVIAQLPQDATLRAQVAMELQSHIAERVEHGHSVEEALQQLGDPVTLAESYLAAVPLIAASFWRRATAKLLDVLVYVGFCAPLVVLMLYRSHFGAAVWVAVFLLAIGAFYTLVAEYLYGQTLGKHWLRLRVVRESGARISFGQSVVRQLPLFLEIFWIDVLFALFTEKNQRAFEILSKTRVVVATENQS
jgi:uncharacterized RDD family membrane protein YckC